MAPVSQLACHKSFGRSNPWLHAIILSALLLASGAALSKSVGESEWVEVKSENFLIRSQFGERQTVQAARFLELLRATIPIGMLPDGWWSQSPDVIYLFKKRKHIEEVGRTGYMEDPRYFGGPFHYIHRDGPRFILVYDNKFVEYGLMGVYPRFLVTSDLPSEELQWIEDGLAWFFGNAGIQEGRFRFGPNRRRGPMNCPLVKLISGPDRSNLSDGDRRVLERCSYALIVYLTRTRHHLGMFGTRLQKYLDLRAEGSGPVMAFEQAFDVAIDKLPREMYRWWITECCLEFEFPVETLLPHFEPHVARLGPGEAAMDLAMISIVLDQREKAIGLLCVAADIQETEERARAELDQLKDDGESPDRDLCYVEKKKIPWRRLLAGRD